MTNNELTKTVGDAWEVIIDNDVSVKEVLNALTEEIGDNITLKEGELLYTNVLWWDSTDLSGGHLGILDMFKDLKIKTFAVVDSIEYDATAVAVIYTRGQK